MRIASVVLPRTALSLFLADTLCLIFCTGLLFHLELILLGGHLQPLAAVWPVLTSGALSALFLCGVVLVTNFAMGLYRRKYIVGKVALLSLLASSLISLTVWVFFDHLLFSNEVVVRDILFGFLIVFLFMAAVRPVVCYYYQNIALKTRLVLVGSEAMVAKIQSAINRVSPPEFEVIDYLPLDRPNRANLQQAVAKAQAKGSADEIVVEWSPGHLAEFSADARSGGATFARLTSELSMIEKVAYWTDVELQGTLAKPDFTHWKYKLFWVKRFAESLIALAGVVFALPVLLGTALLIKLEDGGPLFYTQERVGKLGRAFSVIKFRTMIVDAEADGKAQWAQKNDSRVTRIGGFLRRSRIDEIPQLFNVIRGDMALVGPRPERPEIVQMLNERIPNYNIRHIIRPGLTGWAQVSYPYGASVEDALWKTKYDLYYVRHWSLFFDLAIIFQTIRVVLFAEGAR